MCTATWFYRDGGYDLFFNRDERRTRGPEIAPAVRSCGAARWVGALDSEGGGTWLAVNEHGVALGMLNGAAAPEPPADASPAWLSRGGIPLLLVDATSLSTIQPRLAGLDLARYRPFLLAALAPQGSGLVAAWDGRGLRVAPLPPEPLISPSFDTAEIRASRREVLRQRLGAADDPVAARLGYHASHEPVRGPLSVCLHRPEARTVSFCHVSVDPARVVFRHVGESPCRGRAAASVVLERPGSLG